MSPRAACRLESLGFEQVYEYRPGKSDWTSAGLPFEGKLAVVPRIGSIARQNVPLAHLSDRVGEVARRAEGAGWDTALVVNAGGVLLGRLYKTQLKGDPNARVEDVMKSGPSTFRPDVDVMHMTHFMEEHGLTSAPVTTSDGVVVGMVLVEDLKKVMKDLESGMQDSEA